MIVKLATKFSHYPLNCIQENDRWQDAIRIAKEYLPNRLKSLQDEYEQHMTKSQGANVVSLVTQARNWELQGEFSRAVECYFKVICIRILLVVRIIKTCLLLFFFRLPRPWLMT